jgi:diguanylate cyclase (GGDEF)-like protein
VKILVVDDSPTPRLLLQRELESLGHECIVAEDGVQGLEAFRGSNVDVVISDWMMPNMDGDEFCRRVRSDTSAPYAYFILLTSLGNRRRQDEDLELLAGRAERYGHCFCVALFDVDRFKAYNDTAGHPAGDDVLRSVAAELVRQSRRGDAVYRYGGEELLVVFPEQDLGAAEGATERMRHAIEELGIHHPGIEGGGVVTVSAGVESFNAEQGDHVAALLERVDAALYEAKRAGRNRVVTSRDGRPTDQPVTDGAPGAP